MKKLSTTHRPTLLSLFTGAGGLDIGLEAAGFSSRLCVEVDADARATLNANRPAWRLAFPGDIHRVAPEKLVRQAGLRRGEVSLLAGGPPCQPFSKSAYWSHRGARRLEDPRSATLHAYLKVVEAAVPSVILLENVKGLATDGKDEGLQLLRDELQAINRRQGTAYEPNVIHLNAADYGVPQIRERVFIVASVTGERFVRPEPTHGDQQGLEPYRTAWDAIGAFDTAKWPTDLDPTGKWAGLLKSIPEGQNYLWHTPKGGGEPLFGWRTRYWSFLLKLAKNQPSWTIQAEPGPATGPFHWKSRRLSIDELAALQTFPAGYRFSGDMRSAQRQIGNAVPCAIGELLGLEIRRQLFGARIRRGLLLIPPSHRRSPPSEHAHPVPREYHGLRGKHEDHPGAGRGPAARLRQQGAIAAA